MLLRNTYQAYPVALKGFFGITENEEMLLKVLEPKASLCLVSIHPESELYFITDWSGFQTYDMNKRIQYQIQLR
jgi:hypothetical protein